MSSTPALAADNNNSNTQAAAKPASTRPAMSSWWPCSIIGRMRASFRRFFLIQLANYMPNILPPFSDATNDNDIYTLTGNKWWNCDNCGLVVHGYFYYAQKPDAHDKSKADNYVEICDTCWRMGYNPTSLVDHLLLPREFTEDEKRLIKAKQISKMVTLFRANMAYKWFKCFHKIEHQDIARGMLNATVRFTLVLFI